MSTTGEVLNQTAAAKYLGTTRNTLRRALISRQLPAQRIGRRWFISRAALDAWLSAASPATAAPSQTASHAER